MQCCHACSSGVQHLACHLPSCQRASCIGSDSVAVHLPLLQDPETKPESICALCAARGAAGSHAGTEQVKGAQQPAAGSSHQTAATQGEPLMPLRMSSDIDIMAIRLLLHDFPELEPPPPVSLVSRRCPCRPRSPLGHLTPLTPTPPHPAQPSLPAAPVSHRLLGTLPDTDPPLHPLSPSRVCAG